MIDYTVQNDQFVENSIKELIDISVTSEMKELLNLLSEVYQKFGELESSASLNDYQFEFYITLSDLKYSYECKLTELVLCNMSM